MPGNFNQIQRPSPDRDPTPPRWADWLLEYFVAPHLLEYVQGDLHEMFTKRVKQGNLHRARREYIWAVFRCLTPFFAKRNHKPYPTLSYIDMLQNYLRIALRSVRRNTSYTLLNGIGLAVSLAVAALIILYVHYEKSHDRWIAGQEEVYRVYRQFGEEKGGSAWTPSPLAAALRMQFPQIRQATQLNNQGEALVTLRGTNKALYVKSSIATDSLFLTVLPLPLRYGHAQTALQKPYSALLSAELAAKLFGGEDPVGKVLRYNDKTDYQITGVLAAFPAPLHLEAEVYLTDPGIYSDFWQGNASATYVRLQSEANLARLEGQITLGINSYLQKANANDLPDWRLQPLQDIHLYSTRIGGPFPGRGDSRSLYILSGVATLILIIASINYTNLATAQSVGRAKEVGVRKVNGATRGQLIVQFLTEAVLQSLVALPLAAGLAMLSLPAFNSIVDRNLTLGLAQWQQIGGTGWLWCWGWGSYQAATRRLFYPPTSQPPS
jgi:putative ABC transport system permease protein